MQTNGSITIRSDIQYRDRRDLKLLTLTRRPDHLVGQSHTTSSPPWNYNNTHASSL